VNRIRAGVLALAILLEALVVGAIAIVGMIVVFNA
jgi:hypothetical protein